MQRQFSIKVYAVALVFITALPLMVVSGVASYFELQRNESQAIEQLRLTTIDVASDVKRWVDDHKRMLAAIASRPAIKALDCDNLQIDLLEYDTDYITFAFIKPSGELVCRRSKNPLVAQPALSPAEALKRPIVQTVARANAFVIGPATLATLSKSWLLAMAIPVTGYDGSVVGYLFLSTALLDPAQKLFGSRSGSPTIAVVDQNANHVMRWPEPAKWIGRPVKLELPTTPTIDGVMMSRSATAIDDGQELITASLPIEGTSWLATVQIPRDQVRKTSLKAANRLAAILWLISVLIASATYYGALLISRPIQDVAKLARTAAKGEALPDFSSSRAPNEIVETARALFQMTQSIANSEARYRELIEGTNAVLWLADDKTYKARFVSGHVQQLLGYYADEWLRPDFDFGKHVPQEDLAVMLKAAKAGMSSGKPWEYSFRFMRPDGKLVWIRNSGSHDPVAGVIRGIMFDITERVQMEEQLRQSEKLAAVGQLAGGVAHDVNNDLAIVLSSAEMVQQEADPGSRVEVLSKRIIETVERSTSLVQRMLAFSRKATVKPVELDLSNIVGEFVETIGQTLGRRVAIRYTRPAWPAWVKVDRGMLESSLINLAVNSKDAMPDGGTLTFALSTDRQESPTGVTDWVVLSATDTGVGMSEETRKRMFEPFFTTKPLGGGTGLGLATVYGFVTQSGGDIEVQSTLGVGSKFTIRLPQIQPAEVPLERLDA